MKNFALFTLTVLLALVQFSLLPLNLLFGLVCFLALSLSSWEPFAWAFLAGLFLDLFGGFPLGFSSLGFLVVAFLFFVYKNRFSFKSPITVLIFVFLGNFLFYFFGKKPFFYKEAVFWAIVFTFLRIFAPALFEGFSPRKEEQRIKI